MTVGDNCRALYSLWHQSHSTANCPQVQMFSLQNSDKELLAVDIVTNGKVVWLINVGFRFGHWVYWTLTPLHSSYAYNWQWCFSPIHRVAVCVSLSPLRAVCVCFSQLTFHYAESSWYAVPPQCSGTGFQRRMLPLLGSRTLPVHSHSNTWLNVYSLKLPLGALSNTYFTGALIRTHSGTLTTTDLLY
jgi:hypothetical protein